MDGSSLLRCYQVPMSSRDATSHLGGAASDEAAPRGAFSVRLPPALYRELRHYADQHGTSMNNVIADALAGHLGRPDLAPTSVPKDIDSRIAADAVGESDRTVGALKGIAKHLLNLGQVALSAVVYAAAARMIAGTEGDAAASRELAFTADQVQRHNYLELAVALYEECLRRDPNNLEAVNRLGQLLHHLGQRAGDDLDRYRRASELLSRVTFIDNRAKLFHGWTKLHLSRSEGDRYGEEAALREIEEAMKAWAFGQHDATERDRWLRQLRRLIDFDEKYSGLAHELIEFAAANGWRTKPVTKDDLASTR
jgi:tetratricopeptide (TPR) repeat protein